MLPKANSKDLFNEWKEHPATRALIEWCALQRQALMEQWAAGNFTDASKDGTAQLNAENVGKCIALGWVQTIEPSDLTEEEE